MEATEIPSYVAYKPHQFIQSYNDSAIHSIVGKPVTELLDLNIGVVIKERSYGER